MAARAFQGTEEPEDSIFLLHIPSRVPGEALSFDPADGRDLTIYEFGGQVEECSWKPGEEEFRECVAKRETARRFIFDQWRSKKRSYIAIHLPCIDCMPTLHVFLEPDDAGRWRIVSVLEENRFDPERWPDALDVTYRKATRDERRREQTVRVLSFLDSSGSEVDSF